MGNITHNQNSNRPRMVETVALTDKNVETAVINMLKMFKLLKETTNIK